MENAVNSEDIARLETAKKNTQKLMALKCGDEVLKDLFAFGNGFLAQRGFDKDIRLFWKGIEIMAAMTPELSMEEALTLQMNQVLSFFDLLIPLLDLVARSQVEILRVASIQYGVLMNLVDGMPVDGGEENDR